MIERYLMPGAPAPRGPYSHAVRAGDFIYVSGMVAIDPATNQFSLGDIRYETRVTIENIKRILEGAGASLADVVRCGVFLKDRNDFAEMNAVYAEYFGDAKPARTTLEVVLPAPEVKIEIDCVAWKPLK